MDKVRFGIVGIGGMGRSHAGRFTKGEIAHGELTAVADISPDALEWAKNELPESVSRFSSAEEMYTSGKVDAVLVSTPHYDHPGLCASALQCGLHALSEKPAGGYALQVKELYEVAAKSDRVFGIMLNQRTRPVHRKMHEIVLGGELGRIFRTNVIITDWFRTQSYYDNGDWRGTWKGEGGGVLLNQCPHNLDLWQWICGMPKRLIAFCRFGHQHNVEVEDEVTCYVEYENSASGVLVASTGEAPGTNRFEIAGDRGRLLLEGGKLTFLRTCESVSGYLKESKSGFEQPDIWDCTIPAKPAANEHGDIINNFIDAIRTGEKLLAPGTDGINSLELSNAMLLSTWTNGWVDVPVDSELFYKHLKERMDSSRYTKTSAGSVMDVAGTF